jgi:predicted metal-dependent peptidase
MKSKEDPKLEAWKAGYALIAAHPMFRGLIRRAHVGQGAERLGAPGMLAYVARDGQLHCNLSVRLSAEEWAWVIAHNLLHLGFGHIYGPTGQGDAASGAAAIAWGSACCVVASRFLRDVRVGKPPSDVMVPEIAASTDEQKLFRRFMEEGRVDEQFRRSGTGGTMADMPERIERPAQKASASGRHYHAQATYWPDVLGASLADAVTVALEVAAGRRDSMSGGAPGQKTEAEIAREWFMASFPLLGSLAAGFRLCESAADCQARGIAVAAVDPSVGVVYINPAARLTTDEMRFVMAHELLHVGLRHDIRCEGRDPELWNVACDFVINAWLTEMGIGTMPAFGGLYDVELAGLSAEAVYDRIVRDLRKFKKLATLRGVGVGDMLAPNPDFWRSSDGVRLDEWYRSALSQGLEFHQAAGRGLLPAGLIEEIRAVMLPPIPWDVRLARWFDEYFQPVERRRTYARPSRRQSSTPDIPRATWHVPQEVRDARTFGVVIDTSGSMPTELLARALGAIASYGLARDVAAVRVVFCDAAPYDQGYMAVEEIMGRVAVRGRGGTVLEPAFELLEAAKDFPKDGPVLVITDGAIDHAQPRRTHAWLLPAGKRLPFTARGPVFYVEE